jgi:hypothetical protein
MERFGKRLLEYGEVAGQRDQGGVDQKNQKGWQAKKKFEAVYDFLGEFTVPGEATNILPAFQGNGTIETEQALSDVTGGNWALYGGNNDWIDIGQPESGDSGGGQEDEGDSGTPESDDSGGDSEGDSDDGAGSGSGSGGKWEYSIPAQDNGNPHWPSTVANSFLNLGAVCDTAPAWHKLCEWNGISTESWGEHWEVGKTLTVEKHGADASSVDGLEKVESGGESEEKDKKSGGGKGGEGGESDMPMVGKYMSQVLQWYNDGTWELGLTAWLIHGFADSHGGLLKEKIDQEVDGTSQDTLAYKLAERGQKIGSPVKLSNFADELLEGLRTYLQAWGAWGSHAVAVTWINNALGDEGGGKDSGGSAPSYLKTARGEAGKVEEQYPPSPDDRIADYFESVEHPAYKVDPNSPAGEIYHWCGI